jgi:hypothetical protein
VKIRRDVGTGSDATPLRGDRRGRATKASGLLGASPRFSIFSSLESDTPRPLRANDSPPHSNGASGLMMSAYAHA